MGINMPARTVLFTSASKFDGKDFRWVSENQLNVVENIFFFQKSFFVHRSICN